MLWPHSGEQITTEFNEAAARLQLQDIRPCRYGTRHGGASEDLRRKLRTHLEVKRRGRWADDRSLRRYGKETKLQQELSKIDGTVITFGMQMEPLLLPLLHQSVALPTPPVLPVARATKSRRRS